jgi:hypothetical protein
MERSLHGGTVGPHGRRTVLRQEHSSAGDDDLQSEQGANHDHFWTTSFIRGSMDEGTVRDTCASTWLSKTASLLSTFSGCRGMTKLATTQMAATSKAPAN